MKGNNPLFNNGGNKKISRSKYSTNQNKPIEAKPFNNKKGEKLLNKVKTEEAKNYIRQHYRSGAKIGDGSTAAAVKEELKNGVKVGGKSHITKAKEGVRYINNTLKKNPNHIDKKFFNSQKRKLESALRTKPIKGGKKQ